MNRPPAEPQTPAGDGIFLDHVGWFVSDMDAAANDFARLGFPMTPLTVHQNAQPDGRRVPSGTANRCAMIARGYLEVLIRLPDLDTPLTRQMDAALDRYDGLHLIAFAVADTAAAAERLRENGFDPAAPVALRRPMPLDAGGEAVAGFSVLRLLRDDMPEGRIQILTHETPDTVWQPSVTAAGNAADMLSGLLICCGDPDEAAARYARFAGRKATGEAPLRRIALDRGEIAIADPAACRALLPGVEIPSLPFMAAVAVRSADLAATRAFLAAGGVRLIADEPGRLIVHPEDGAGACFVMHAHGTDPFGTA